MLLPPLFIYMPLAAALMPLIYDAMPLAAMPRDVAIVDAATLPYASATP